MSSPERKAALRAAKKRRKRAAELKKEEKRKAKKLKMEEERNRGETEEITAQVSNSEGSEKPQPQQQPNAAANSKPNSSTEQPEAPATLHDEKCRQIQQQLLLYLHAQYCLRRERLSNGAEVLCSVTYCEIMRGLLKHMPTCRTSRDCTVTYCNSTRYMIGHWNNCSDIADCPVCAPLRKRVRERRTGNIAALDLTVSLPKASIQEIQLVVPVAQIPVMDLERPIDVSNVSMPRPKRVLGAARPAPTVSTNHSLSDIAAIVDEQKRLIHLSESLYDDSTLDSPHSLDLDINIIPFPSRVQWEWHEKVFPVLRKHLIKELIQMRISTFELPSILDRHLQEMTHYSHSIEKMCFEEAESKSRYLFLIAEKMYKLKVDFDGKQKFHKRKLNKIGELLETGKVTVPADETAERLNLRINQQRQPDSRPQPEHPRQSENLRIHPLQSPPRRPPFIVSRPIPVPSMPPMPSAAPTGGTPINVTLHLDVLLADHQQHVLRQWYVKQRQWLFEKQQMEQTVPGSTGYYDTDDFLTL